MYQTYSKLWTSNGPITIHYLLNESCKPKCSWGISNSRLWPERPITQQLTIAMMGKLRSSEQIWDSLSRPVPSVYNRRPIKYSKDLKRLGLHRRTQRLEITSDISISNHKSRHLYRVQGKMFLDKILPENEWESVQHDQKKQATSRRLSLCIIMLHTLQFISLNYMLYMTVCESSSCSCQTMQTAASSNRWHKPKGICGYEWCKVRVKSLKLYFIIIWRLLQSYTRGRRYDKIQ